MSNKTEISILVDNVGRTIVGRIKQNETTVDIENPTVVNIEVKQDTGQIAVQLIPFVFKEFLIAEQREGSVTWKFPKNMVVISDDIKVDDQLKTQYENVFKPAPAAKPVQSEPEVVKLFDDE
jgi:hypothetical protein